MTLFKRLIRPLALGTLALACAGLSQAQVKIKMTTPWTPGINIIEVDKHFVKLVNAIGGNRVKIEFFEGGTLVPPMQVFDATVSGTVDASADWPGYWAGQSSAFALLGSFPMLMTANDYLLWIMQWGGFEAFQEVYGRHGIVYLPYGVAPMESGLRSNRPLTSLADLKGKRLRMSGRPQGEVLKQLGAAQVALPGGEVYQALERGVVDAAEFSSPGVDWGMSLQEVSKHWLAPGWHQPGSALGVMINKKVWDKLGPEGQAVLKTAADATLVWSLAFLNKADVQATRDFQKKGVQIHRLKAEELDRLQAIANEVLVRESCADPLFARVALSKLLFLEDYKQWREMQGPFGFGRNPTLPDIAKVKACAEKK